MGYYTKVVDLLHEQSVAASSWTVTHNINAHPVIDVFILNDTTYEKMIPMEINYISGTQATIVFSQPFSGYARIR